MRARPSQLALFIVGLIMPLQAMSPAVQAQSAGGTGAVPYDPDALQQDSNRIANAQPLSDADTQAKAKAVAYLNKNGTGTLLYHVGYVAPPTDQFQATILDDGSFYGRPIDQIKQDVIDLFKSQFGFSDQGLCDLPLVFVVDDSTAEDMVRDGLMFDPTIAGCAENVDAVTPSVGSTQGLEQLDWETVFRQDPDLSTDDQQPAICHDGEMDLWVQYRADPSVEGHPWLSRVQYGDIAGDGGEEAIVDLLSSCTGGADNSLIYRMTATGPRIAATGPGSGRMGPLRIVDGTLEARIGQYDPGQGGLNCPFGGVKVVRYRLGSGGLQQVSSNVEDAPGCPKPQAAPPSTGTTAACPLGASLPAQIIATFPNGPSGGTVPKAVPETHVDPSSNIVISCAPSGNGYVVALSGKPGGALWTMNQDLADRWLQAEGVDVTTARISYEQLLDR